MWEASEDRCSIYMGGSATTIIKEIHPGKTGPKTRQDLAQNLVGYIRRWLLLASGALPRVDRRQEGGTQKDVVLEAVFKPPVKKVEEQPEAKSKEAGKVAKWPS